MAATGVGAGAAAQAGGGECGATVASWSAEFFRLAMAARAAGVAQAAAAATEGTAESHRIFMSTFRGETKTKSFVLLCHPDRGRAVWEDVAAKGAREDPVVAGPNLVLTENPASRA